MASVEPKALLVGRVQSPCRQGQQVTVRTGAGGPEPDPVAPVALEQHRAMITAGFGQLSLTALEAWGKD